MTTKTPISAKEKADIRTLFRFIAIYCKAHHSRTDKAPFAFRDMSPETLGLRQTLLCPDCTRLMKYALTMRLRCPHDPKRTCKKCYAPCYNGEYRQKIREVMRFSGLYLIKHGRLDLLLHYLI